MTDKIRVKDLSSELGVTNRELMQTLRDLGIQAKSHMSALTEEEALEARRRISDQPASTEVIRKEVQPGMIVRRRRKRAPEEKKPAPEPEEEAAPEAGAPKEAPAEAVASEHAEAEPAEAEPVEETAAEVPAREVEKAPEEPLQAEPAEAGEDAEASEAAPEEEPAGAEPEEPKRKEKKAKKPKPKVEAGPQVKVISKPKAPPKAETEPVAIEPAAPKEPATPPPQEAEAKKKKKKKDKRVVEFSPHLVDEEERRAANLHAKKKRRADMKTASKAKKGKRRGPAEMEARPAAAQPAKAAKRKIKVDEAIRVADLAKQMGVKAQALIKVLFDLGVMTTINQSIDIDTATLAAGEFGYEVEKVGFSEEEFLSPAVDTEAEEPEKLKPRAPVVTIMGHVDHGKTSLLDAIRESDVISGEAGGITQHIGAYDVTTPRGKVVFLDTPGHEAFTAMRARGAQVTDLVILVVAADDGVMDQTREAINHSKAAGVPILVAVNKIDKDEANPDRVKRELADHGLVPEDWGGDTIFSEVSAKKHIGLEELLELVLLQAEVLELKANPDKRAIGRIVEARLDIGRGPVATVLIQGGTLRQGDAFVCGVHHGKVRAMFDDQGKKVKEAGPATPVEVQGFDSVPEAGDEFVCVEDDKVARRIAQTRLAKVRERQLAKENKVTLESFMAQRVGQEVKTLNLVLKADVQGSLEAVQEALNKLSTDEVKVDVVHSGAGAITESDIMLASASEAIIIGFNVRPTAKIKEVADQENVEIRFYDIIYKLVGDIKDAMAGMLEPVISEKYLGQAEVRDTFNVPKVGTVAGCYVEDGVLQRNAEVRLLRDGVVIYTGKLSSLKRYKEDAKEVAKGYECGAGLERFNDIKVGDVIEAFTKVEERPTL